MNIGIVGAGSLGTAIAQLIANNSNNDNNINNSTIADGNDKGDISNKIVDISNIFLYARRSELAIQINSNNVNADYFPTIPLNKKIIGVSDFSKFGDCDIIFLCVPSSGLRNTLNNIKNDLGDNFDSNVIFVSTIKGVEQDSLKTTSQIISEYFDNSCVVFSGPNFASEIAINLPTVANLASSDINASKKVKEVLENTEFKVEIINDAIGVEFCGIIKNINAIAYGICQGMNINDNARFAVLTKAFNENKNIIKAIGGQEATIDDYCGFGDIILTSTSKESRNHTLGMLYGQRIVIDEKSSGVIFEGKNSIKAIKKICDDNSVNSIIVEFVYDVLVNNILPKSAFITMWRNL
ncbi:MAG: NAD(P)H-dependent glycerol-3-phosphate dehydrogenase [Methanobacteriaceae archaeon]